MNRIVQEAAIYASHTKDSENIAWSKDPDWSNLEAILMENGMTEIAELCSQGMWLLYEKQEYTVMEKTGYRLMTGEYHCTNKPGKLISMQPFGSEGVMESSITFFSEKYFGSKAFPLSMDTTRTTMDLFYGSVRSLIVTGKDDWMVIMETADSTMKPLCIRPEPIETMATMPICSLQSVEFTALEPNVRITFARKGCTDVTEEANIISLSDCKPFEDPKPEPEESEEEEEEEPKSRSMGARGPQEILTCKGGSANDELTVLLRFLKLRREVDFRTEPTISWTNNNDNTWKSEIADLTFNIAMTACPDLAASEDFFSMASEAFMFELQEAWNSGAPEVDNKEVEMLITQLSKCLRKTDVEGSQKMSRMTIGKIMNEPFTESAGVHPKLQWNETYNLVVDVAWIAANLVASYCHTTFNYKTNFWYNYIRVFSELYLEPLAKTNKWKNGLTSRARHNYYLSGFGIDSQLTGIALCASNAIRINPNMEPFERPLMS